MIDFINNHQPEVSIALIIAGFLIRPIYRFMKHVLSETYKHVSEKIYRHGFIHYHNVSPRAWSAEINNNYVRRCDVEALEKQNHQLCLYLIQSGVEFDSPAHYQCICFQNIFTGQKSFIYRSCQEDFERFRKDPNYVRMPMYDREDFNKR